MLSLSFSDWFGYGLALLCSTFALWLANKIVRSEDDLVSLFTTWPRTGARGFRVWLAIAAAIASALCLMLRVDTIPDRLSRGDDTVPGTFVQYEGNHGQFRYIFVAHGLQYNGYEASNEHEISQIQAGVPFKVYYDPANPNVSTVSEPGHHAATEKLSLFFFGTFIIGLSAVFIRKLGALMRTPDYAGAVVANGE